MGWTSEMLALDYSISRAKQDEYGLLSHNRAESAQKAGKFDQEIIKINTTVLSDPKNPSSERTPILADKDDGIRAGQTIEKMRLGKPAFKDYGDARSTGANSSQMTDGGAMVMMMSRRKAEELGLEVLAKHVTTSVVGVSPRVMGVGPVYAIP
jgi:acetyl-CoA acyltransferase 1